MSEPAVAAMGVGPGTILVGKYRIERILGSGAMGTVFAALHEKLGRQVAIKVLNPELGSHREAMARFQREAETITRLGHPNIVAVYDFGTCPDGAPFFVMEVVTGETLRKRLERGPLTDDEIIALFAPILSATAAAHIKGIVHRDLKPENVMLVGRGGGTVVKLLDFGVAKIRGDEREEYKGEMNAGKLSALATAVGAMMGTPAYMSPEQIKATGEIDGRADIYSIGVMLYEAVTGERPFSGGSMASLLGAHLFETAEKPSERAKRLKLPRRAVDMARLDRVIERTLSKAREERYPDCLALRDDLDVVWGGLGLWKEAGVGHPVTTRPVRVQPERRGKKWALVLFPLLVCGVATGAWMFSRPANLHRYKSNSAPGLAMAVLEHGVRGSTADKRAVATAIEAVPQRPLLPLVTVLFKDENVPKRPLLLAAYAMGQTTDTDLKEHVATVAKNSVGVQAALAQAVRLRLGEKDAATVLDAAAASGNLPPEARLWAGLVLLQTGHAQLSAFVKLKDQLLRPGHSMPKVLRHSVFLELLKHKDATTEKQLWELGTAEPATAESVDALEVLGEAGRSEAETALRKLLDSKTEGEARTLAIMALARLGDDRVTNELCGLFRHETHRVHAVAAAGFLRSSSKIIREQLLPLISSSDAGLQTTAAAALLAIASKDSDVGGE